MGCNFTFRFQSEPGGIAQAVGMAEDFVNGDRVAVCLGDNIFTDDLSRAIKGFSTSKMEAALFLKKVPDPQRFGVAELKDGRIASIVEKPKDPKSDLAVTGLYLYDGASLFRVIKTLKPSGRGELEITDVNNHYVKGGKAEHHLLSGDWSDAGTFESLYRASALMRSKVVKA
jgi:glucose-1-phosphate thymidylyltransferase